MRPYVRVCYSEHSVYFGWILYAIEGALLTFGAFLAWETRKVKDKKCFSDGNCYTTVVMSCF